MTCIPICGYVAMYNIVYGIRGIGLYYYYNIRTIIIITSTTHGSKGGWIRLLSHTPTTTTTTTTNPPSIETTSNAVTAYTVLHLLNRELAAASSRLHTCA